MKSDYNSCRNVIHSLNWNNFYIGIPLNFYDYKKNMMISVKFGVNCCEPKKIKTVYNRICFLYQFLEYRERERERDAFWYSFKIYIICLETFNFLFSSILILLLRSSILVLRPYAYFFK